MHKFQQHKHWKCSRVFSVSFFLCRFIIRLDRSASPRSNPAGSCILYSSSPRLVSVLFLRPDVEFRAEAAAADIHMAGREHTHWWGGRAGVLLPIWAHTHLLSCPGESCSQQLCSGHSRWEGGEIRCCHRKSTSLQFLLFHWQEGKFHCHFCVEWVSGTFYPWKSQRNVSGNVFLHILVFFWFGLFVPVKDFFGIFQPRVHFPTFLCRSDEWRHFLKLVQLAVSSS